MNTEIEEYNNRQSGDLKRVCEVLAKEIQENLPDATSKVWHGGPVWFLDENPVVGYWVRKSGKVQLLFWSGQSFDEPGLEKEGSYKASHKHFSSVEEINKEELHKWLKKAARIQWDYKNIVKRKGELVKIGDW